MTSSSPEEASEIRGQTLSPVSPKPLLYPSPTNIPILEKSMEPAFDHKLAQPGADLSTILQPSEPNAEAAESDSDPYAEPADGESNGKDVANTAADAGANDDYAQTLAMEDESTENQDTTAATQSMAQSNNTLTSAPSDVAPEPAQPPAESTPADDLNRSAIAPPAAQQSSHPSNPPSTDPTAGGVDFQAILDNLSANPPSFAAAHGTTPSNYPPVSSLISPTSTLGGNPNLPPRPPPQAGIPSLPSADDIRNYHKIPSANYKAQTNLPSLVTASATGANGLPPPPTASFQQTPQSAMQPSPADANYRQRDVLDRAPAGDDTEGPWGPEIQRLYDDFLAAERSYVTDGQWDKFPLNSRLFIGKATRRNSET
jgi:hypothetical protein